MYIDAGVNWCNTIQLHDALPGPENRTLAQEHMRQQQISFHARTPWVVFGFEASPIIALYAQNCTDALDAGQPLPRPPIDSVAGSSAELYRSGAAYNCTMPGNARFDCILAAARPQLHALERSASQVQRLSNKAIKARMDSAAHKCPLYERNSYTFVPAAVGDRNGTIELSGSSEALLRGGLMSPRAFMAASRQHQGSRLYSVPVIDLVRWIKRSFVPQDFLLLKLDVEGSEQTLVPALAALPAVAQLIDVLVWECHSGGRLPCHTLLELLKGAGVGAIYQEPKSWPWKRTMCTAPLWRHPSLRRQADAPERHPLCRSRTWWRHGEDGAPRQPAA